MVLNKPARIAQRWTSAQKCQQTRLQTNGSYHLARIIRHSATVILGVFVANSFVSAQTSRPSSRISWLEGQLAVCREGEPRNAGQRRRLRPQGSLRDFLPQTA